MDRNLTLSGVQNQSQCKNMLKNCGHIGHWSNEWLKSTRRNESQEDIGAPFGSVDRFHGYPYREGWVVPVLFQSPVPAPAVT